MAKNTLSIDIGLGPRDVTTRYLALATDYDGTIATHGIVDADTLTALARARDAGLKLVLVSGRERESLRHTFDRFELFERMVLENGGVIYDPATGQERMLCSAPPARFVQALHERGVQPLSVGRVIIATVEPNDTMVLEVIRELGLEYQVIFNKGAVMVLPAGVTKATGLKEALAELGVDTGSAVAVGDAENDHALLELCGFGAAVANALPALKERADIVLAGDHGAGVAELIDLILADSLRPAARKGPPTLSMGAAGSGAEVLPDA